LLEMARPEEVVGRHPPHVGLVALADEGDLGPGRARPEGGRRRQPGAGQDEPLTPSEGRHSPTSPPRPILGVRPSRLGSNPHENFPAEARPVPSPPRSAASATPSRFIWARIEGHGNPNSADARRGPHITPDAATPDPRAGGGPAGGGAGGRPRERG